MSIGHKISLGTAFKVVKMMTVWDSPEPVRLVDMISRKKVRKMWEKEYESAASF